MLLSSLVLQNRACNAILRRHLATYRVAIVGTGPSGCYSAKYLQSSLHNKNHSVQIDMIERLPTPFGLVRYGVAPDHPEVKNVETDFAALFGDNNNNNHTIRLWANVHVGRDVSVSELRQLYDAVILAYGCESDQKLTDLPGSDHFVSAREFVAWYNGHPDFVNWGDRIAPVLLSSNDDDNDKTSNDNTNNNHHVVVIGQGNVALDCARILAKGPDHLADTDLAAHARNMCRPAHVTVVGRRGPAQSAFTIKELRELVHLPAVGAAFCVDPDEVARGLTAASQQELDKSRPKRRLVDLLQKAAAASHDNNDNNPTVQVHLRFLLRPAAYDSDTKKLICEVTRLEGPPGQQRAVGTGQYEHLPADLVLVSIGYRGRALTDAFFDDTTGTYVHQHGRVDAVNSSSSSIGGLYVAGWLKRGPSGIIGTNIPDAKDTVASVVADLLDRAPRASEDGRLGKLLEERQVTTVTFQEFLKLDAYEREHTRNERQPREKVLSIEEQIAIAKR